MRYTAAEILKLAGIGADVLGKVRVQIGGVPVNKPDHIVNMQDAEQVTVLVGFEEKVIDLPEPTESRNSEGAAKIKEAHGKILSEKAEALKASKKSE